MVRDIKQNAGTAPLALLSILIFVFTFVLSMAAPAHAGFKFVPADGAAMGAAAAPANPVVEGFADRVPLVVALRQILPRGTIYNIAPDVDMGVLVSWQGGQPWQQVLNAALANVGLQAAQNGNTVNVRRAAYLNGNVSGTSEPIQLMPPVKLTPPISPVVIDDTAPTRPALTVQGEVTSADDVPSAAPVAPVTKNLGGNAFEVTSNDADVRAEVSGGAVQMGSPPGYLTLPAGAEDAAAPGAMVDSTLAPLDGAEPAPMVIGESSMSGPNTWDARAGQTLRDVLSGWAERAGIELNWQSEYDYPVQASLNYAGDFEEAVRTLLHGFKDATPQPIGRLHKNGQIGQQVLLITTRGNIYEE